MKHLFTLLAASAALLLSAQPTITNSIFPPAGHIAQYYRSSAAGAKAFNPGASGANVTWNFANIDNAQGIKEQRVVQADTTENISSFPNAVNYALETNGSFGGNDYAYAYLDASKYEYYGYDGFGTFVYTNPVKQLQFPFTYNNQFSDVFHDLDSTYYGTTTVTADAWGTLILPSGTYTNVLRVNVVEDYREKLSDLPEDELKYHVQYYRWYQPNQKNALLEYNHLQQFIDYQGQHYDTDSSWNLAYNKNLSVGINEAEAFETNLYPNPTNSKVFITAATTIEKAQVSDISGRLLSEEFFYDKKGIINIETLAPGTYYVTLSTADGRTKTLKVLRM